MVRKSDYTKVRTNLLRLLPEVFQSSINESLLETTFNRFLSKDETRRVIGYVGQGNPNADIDRQIQESTPHRQAYQLQPLIYNKIGTEEHISSWKDIQAELERLGVDLNRMKIWGDSLAFNWAPPIDYDKIINFRNYFWYNETDISDSPQYVTIQNPCTRAEAQLDEFENTLTEYGAIHPIVAIDADNVSFQIEGDLSLIFTEGLVFYIKNSTNSSINNEFFTAQSSLYDSGTDRTTIIVNLTAGSPAPFDNTPVDGDISLEELKSIFEAERDCKCEGTLGWDGGQWDDNQIGEVIWNTALLTQISHPTLADWLVTNTGSPEPAEFDLWYDTTNDQLKQYVIGSPPGFVVVQNEFSNIIAATTGGERWDLSEQCQFATNPWIEQNKWIHQNQVPNFTIAKQAQIPIIEFIPTMELNEWTQTIYEWKYRAQPTVEEFNDLDTITNQPHIFELIGIGNSDADDYFGGAGSPKVHYEIIADGSPAAGSPNLHREILLNFRYGNLTDIFVPGYEFRVAGSSDPLNDDIYVVESSVFCEQTPGGYYQTVIRVAEPFNSDANDGLLTPTLTSFGDDYLGLYEHWLFVGVRETLPVNRQPENIMLPIENTAPFITREYWQYQKSLFAQDITIQTDCFSALPVVGASSSPPHQWIIQGDHVDAFVDPVLDIIGRKIIIEGNANPAVNGEYTISAGSPSIFLDAGNTVVTVDEPIPGTPIANSGTAHVYWRLTLDPDLFYFTRVDSNELRVYIDGVRQYGTYEESEIAANEGSPFSTTTTTDFVASIIVQTPVELFGDIRIEVGPAAASGFELSSVPVRTEPDDIAFSMISSPQKRSIVIYRKFEQVKTRTNQYPLFDLYNVEGQSVHAASRIFAYQESQDQTVEPNIGKRIVRTSDGREYTFEQFLTDEDNGVLYAYRDTSVGTGFWFDTDNDILYRWDSVSGTWDTRIVTEDYADNPDGISCYLVPVVSESSPEAPYWDIDGAIWFNVNNNTINVSDGSGTSAAWTENTLLTSGTVFTTTDPTLQTIWRTGPDNVPCEERETYIPDYVDEDRNVVPVGDDSGDWEIPDQLYFNTFHENRKTLTSSELLAHFQSIIAAQEVPSGFFNDPASLYHALTDINFGAGGTIKEFNDSYDTFISSVFIQNVNPLQLYEFAHDAYENALNVIKDLFRQDIVSTMTNVSEEFLSDIVSNVADAVITEYEQNDAASIVYGDSNTFDPTTGLGVRNWPATLPFVRLKEAVYPIHILDTELGINTILHHDGHYSQVGYVPTNVELFTLRILSATDTRSSNPHGKMGSTGADLNLSPSVATGKPPEDFNDYQTYFGNNPGIYWRDVTANPRVLYRMAAVRISTDSTPPPTTLPLGSYWYDLTADRLKILSIAGSPEDLDWHNVSGLGVGELADFSNGINGAWEVIDINIILAEIYLELERRLYQATPPLDELAFDFSSLNSELALRNEYREEAFFAFLAQAQTSAPFQNIEFDIDDPFTWNYTQSTPTTTPKIGVTYISGGTWQDVYEKNYGTPYPHFEPWVLQGFESKPTWWDIEYPASTGRRWSTTMWKDIVDGVVPSGRLLPNGDISTGATGEVQDYNYISVNMMDTIAEDAVGNEYSPDELLPPVVELVAGSLVPQGPVGFPSLLSESRSLFIDDTLIVNPDADYEFGDVGLIEWQWRSSSQFSYDELKVAFRMEPVKFIQQTLGELFLELGCLQIHQRSQKVYAHQNAEFHGDLLNDNSVLKLPGTLQWYVNFNRFNGYDGSSSNFRRMWTDWTTFLSYQFASVIDTESFLTYSTNFDVVQQDFFTTLKRSPGFEDHWVDALNVTLIQSPPQLINQDTENQWVFTLDTFSPIGRRVTYYGVRKFPFLVIEGSPLVELEIKDPHSRTLPWNDGQAVILSSDGFLPSPFQLDTFYYINRVSGSSTKFTLSEQPGGPPVEILSTGSQQTSGSPVETVHYVAQVAASFDALNGEATDKIWYRYQLDKDLILDFLPPTTVVGFQDLISIIYGYEAYETDIENFRFNYDATDIDPDTNRVVNWQLEIERLITWAYQARSVAFSRKDFYKFATQDGSPIPNELTFSISGPGGWSTGQKVIVFPDEGGTLPEPLEERTAYFLIRVSKNEFKLAATSRNARQGTAIDIISESSGDVFIQELISRESFPTQEVNPFRNKIWIDHPQGVVSNLIKGPFADVRTDQLLVDQFGRPLPRSGILPLRQDRLSLIRIADGIPNDVNPPVGNLVDPYNYLHLTSAHIFLDGYEHVVLYNNYASDGSLIYDPFIGLNTPRFEMQFDRNPEFTLRPVLGGHVMVQNRDVGNPPEFIRNLEGQITDLRNAYDTYNVVESNNLVQEARLSLGYDGTKNYLFSININPKSQFLFWRGMIQQKGSVNSINAFINSRRFLDARVDDFWAYKIADFGSADGFNLPELNLFSNDGKFNEIRFEFTQEAPSTGFEAISESTPDRWFEFTNQRNFFDTIGNMYFNTQLTVDDNPTFISSGSPPVYYVSDEIFDSVIITHHVDTKTEIIEAGSPLGSPSGSPIGSPVPAGAYERRIDQTLILTEGVDYRIVNSRVVEFITNPTLLNNIRIFKINPAKSKHNPAKVRDIIEEITISPIIIWDPARGHHYHNAIHLVDTQSDTDPVLINFGYDVSGETNFTAPDYTWGRNQVNTTWLDGSRIGYIPYMDRKVFGDTLDRLDKWGELADWAEYKMYQWTESDVLPTEYDALADEQEGDISIDPKVRVTGNVREVTFLNTNANTFHCNQTGENWIRYDFEAIEVPSKLLFDETSVTFSQNPPITLEIEEEEANRMGSPLFGSPSGSPITGSPLPPFVGSPLCGSPTSVITRIYEDSPVARIYRNGELFVGPLGDSETGYYLGTSVEEVATNINIDIQTFFSDEDHIAIVKFFPEEDDIDNEVWKVETPYTTEDIIENDEQVTKYYFWVENKTVRQEFRNKELNMIEAVNQLQDIPVPYLIIQGLSDPLVQGSPGIQTRPQRYNKAVIRGLRNIINADTRYVLRFTRDFTLRDDYQDVEPDRCLPSLLTRHQEWLLFRQEQQFNIERDLWDLATESIIGQTLASLGGTAVRVPSLDRELYDIENNTSTRIGLGNGQALADGEEAWTAVLEYLQDGDNDFTPVDVNEFINTNNVLNLTPRNATDAQDIANVMDSIYNSFPFEHINRIFFSILLNAGLPFQVKYENLLKTSWISVHGIRVLEASGLFDD